MKKQYDTLYKIDTKGRERLWYMVQDEDQYWTVAGLIDGEKVTSDPTTCKGKNVGRANETSSAKQATCEVEADYRKKLAGDYHVSLKEAHAHEKKGALGGRFVKPMLAEKVQECGDCMVFPGSTQPKLNGARAVGQESGLTTRKGKQWVSTPHILEDLAPLFKKYLGVVFDGELYCDTFAHDLGSTMSLIRQSKPTKQDFIDSAKSVGYFVYDLISDGTPDFHLKPFEAREARLKELIDELHRVNPDARIYFVPSKRIGNMKEVQAAFMEYLAANYEGLMFRNLGAPYEFKRSVNLLKYKEFQDEEYKVLDVYEGQGNRSGGCGAFLLGDKNGRAFKSTPKGNKKYFKEILDNKHLYIGKKMATVTFIELTPAQPKSNWKEFADSSGKKWHLNTGEVPYHGVVTAIREDL